MNPWPQIWMYSYEYSGRLAYNSKLISTVASWKISSNRNTPFLVFFGSDMEWSSYRSYIRSQLVVCRSYLEHTTATPGDQVVQQGYGLYIKDVGHSWRNRKIVIKCLYIFQHHMNKNNKYINDIISWYGKFWNALW